MKKMSHKDCNASLQPVKDTLEVIGGKWKLLILISIWEGNHRFREIERSIPKLTSKVLAKELKDLEEHKLICRTVYDESPVRIEYTATTYAQTLQKVIGELYNWGVKHREVIFSE